MLRILKIMHPGSVSRKLQMDKFPMNKDRQGAKFTALLFQILWAVAEATINNTIIYQCEHHLNN
ncbi:hypothetical protein T12_15580 [Trichinella patagoniensis]|uniref:Uncharacterized protein n=1 Tax=Trichinella patagoniensis TaxID=990121 RepID=A0A0V0ZSL7_9BILA|nr:hypothetical protein T12_15580 [Trichinella patagoniensis]